jgi:hypothetical protein
MKAYLSISRRGQLHWSWMPTKIALAAVALLLLQANAFASDPIGVFALIDKVAFEPNEAAPERIRVWGAFALAARKHPDAYKAPEQGYLYFSLPEEKADVARKEWKDLKAAAGKREVIGFGSRYESKVTVRESTAKPTDPDVYVLGWGMVKMSQRSKDYAPIKALLALKEPGKTVTQ